MSPSSMCDSQCHGPEAGQPYAAVRETHSGVVFLVGERAYKAKKPVRFDFLDFTTRGERQRACQEEVVLNRRLSPDCYLGVADVVGPDGRVCDHLVVMQRMPEAARLTTLIRGGTDVADHLRRLARKIAAFHSTCRRGPEIDVEGTRDATVARWLASLGEMRAYQDKALPANDLLQVETLATEFLAGRKALFEARIDRGCVVDGHGDLLADDIFCLPDGPRVLDCLEYDARLRYVDRLDDACCLAMDLERHGRPELGDYFLRAYLDFSGDSAPSALRDQFIAYRALIRAKVACLRADQASRAGFAGARRHLDIAYRHLHDSSVTLTLVGGFPGTGKSTLAGRLADRLGLTVLSSDRVRKGLAGVPADAGGPAPYREGIYSKTWTDRTYRELLAHAERLLGMGESVVMDASWTSQTQRAQARAVATRTHSRLVELQCEAPAQLAAGRIRRRHGVSDADELVAAAMRRDADPWPTAVVLDTVAPVERVYQQAADILRPDLGGRIIAGQPRLAPD